jgi:putative tryptophan/tyrosine transport system substrate-binding protein
MGWSESDPQYHADFVAFVEALALLGWTVGSNLRVEQRWTKAEFARIAPFAKELVALNPDVILSSTTPVTAALHQETSTIPIVFAVVSDPVGAGLVAFCLVPATTSPGLSMLRIHWEASGWASSRRSRPGSSAQG